MKLKHILLICTAIALSSCAGVTSGLTGAPVPTVPVARVGVTPAKPFNVAAADVALAESRPEVAHGLYNAGAVAALVERSGK